MSSWKQLLEMHWDIWVCTYTSWENPDNPEGVAKAYAISRSWVPTAEHPEQPIYSLTYDAKSTKHDRAKTGNLSLDGIEQHRKKYGADYALVVAPGFQEGAADERTKEEKITLMTALDLGRLLELTVEFGAISLDKLEEVFQLAHSSEVRNGLTACGETWRAVDNLRSTSSSSRWNF